MKDFLKNLIPESWLLALRPWYHGLVAWSANIYFNRPSEKLIVIGITGTAGKSTTAAMLAHILNTAGMKTGYITTVNFFDGQRDFINKHGLSMPGGWLLQQQLRAMVKNHCRAAVVECTSEGLAQNRQLGINFDVALFTNLSHAHLEAHGSFGNYQQAKGRLFESLQNGSVKDFFPQKMIGVNFDDPMSGYFLSFPAGKKFGVTFGDVLARIADKTYVAKMVKPGLPLEFQIDAVPFSIILPGNFNGHNAALASVCANMLGVSLQQAAEALKNFHGVRGRMENVPNNLGLTVIVDYGCEPESFRSALEAASLMPRNKLIHLFGSTGGHRDTSKRFAFGKTSAQYADEIIVTNDDVYGSDPNEIAANIEQGISSFKLRKPPYQIVLDRRAAIVKALSLAKQGDLILITGKGSEQFLVLPGNKRIQWDEVQVVKEELKKLT